MVELSQFINWNTFLFDLSNRVAIVTGGAWGIVAGETRKLREVVAKHTPAAYAPNLEYPQPGKYTISSNQLAPGGLVDELAVRDYSAE